jgi:hypothetical protein
MVNTKAVDVEKCMMHERLGAENCHLKSPCWNKEHVTVQFGATPSVHFHKKINDV